MNEPFPKQSKSNISFMLHILFVQLHMYMIWFNQCIGLKKLPKIDSPFDDNPLRDQKLQNISLMSAVQVIWPLTCCTLLFNTSFYRSAKPYHTIQTILLSFLELKRAREEIRSYLDKLGTDLRTDRAIP